MSGPLEGIRILDCTEIIAAPYASSMLSDMGADVIKVEPVAGEPWRLQAQFRPLESRSFVSLNRGKQGITLNLQDERGQEAMHRLVKTADVLLINYRPDTPAKLGIDYDTVSAINPGLVYVWNTAFGRKGPHAHRPGYDIIIQAYSGIMASWGSERGGHPVTMATAIADFTSALTICWAVMTGLYSRERLGKGQLIDTSLLGTAMALQPSRYMVIEEIDRERVEAMKADVRRAREESSTYPELREKVNEARARGAAVAIGDSPGNIYYRTYQCADGFIAVGCLSAALRSKFQAALEVKDPRYSGDPDLAPATEKGREVGRQLVQICEAKFRDQGVEHWLSRLDRFGVPSGPVLFPEELWDDEQVLANGLLVDVVHPTLGKMQMVGPPIQMSDTPLAPQGASPVLGADTDTLLMQVGYSDAEIASLRESGVIR
jgi:crotonobetainyl-CoA:carnitine CoA-transferase CaiB-like acyl-CoA transferase